MLSSTKRGSKRQNYFNRLVSFAIIFSATDTERIMQVLYFHRILIYLPTICTCFHQVLLALSPRHFCNRMGCFSSAKTTPLRRQTAVHGQRQAHYAIRRILLSSLVFTRYLCYRTYLDALPSHMLANYGRPFSFAPSRPRPTRQLSESIPCFPHEYHRKSMDHNAGYIGRIALHSTPVNSPWSTTNTGTGFFPGSPLSVSLDQPLISDNLFTAASSSSAGASTGDISSRWVEVISGLLGWTVQRKRNVATVLILSVLFVAVWKVMRKVQEDEDTLYVNSIGTSKVPHKLIATASMLLRKISRVIARVNVRKVNPGIPMPFPESTEVNGAAVNGYRYNGTTDLVVNGGTGEEIGSGIGVGWGVCTLRSKRRLGKSSYVQYEFDLPQPEYKLALELGQQVSLCCLDSGNNVVLGNFFPYTPSITPKPGSFAILVPNHLTPDANNFELGAETARFAMVLKHELSVGDEVALRPGPCRLTYRGQFLPVTDMVYIAVGCGIVPVLDQIRAVLPKGTSSVECVTVVWINESTRDFDVNAELLEREYFKYNTRLAVSCIVCDLRPPALIEAVRSNMLRVQRDPVLVQPERVVAGGRPQLLSTDTLSLPTPSSEIREAETNIGENVEINVAVPDFQPGTMAVLACPSYISECMLKYLQDRGYPNDTVCIL
jgi:hypothetical protein